MTVFPIGNTAGSRPFTVRSLRRIWSCPLTPCLCSCLDAGAERHQRRYWFGLLARTGQRPLPLRRSSFGQSRAVNFLNEIYTPLDCSCPSPTSPQAALILFISTADG